MRYNFEVRSIAQEAQPIEEKHESFLDGLAGVPAPWGVAQRLPAPELGSEDLCGSLRIGKLLGKGLRGDLVYQFRYPFHDGASDDDWLNIEFNPKKVNYRELIDSVVLKYVSAFDAYYAEIADDEFIFMDFEECRGIDKRHNLYRLPPVSYMRDDFCQRAFGVPPSILAQRVAGHVEEVRLVLGGIFIVLTTEVLPTEQMDRLCWKAKAYLTGQAAG